MMFSNQAGSARLTLPRKKKTGSLFFSVCNKDIGSRDLIEL